MIYSFFAVLILQIPNTYGSFIIPSSYKACQINHLFHNDVFPNLCENNDWENTHCNEVKLTVKIIQNVFSHFVSLDGKYNIQMS